MERRRREVLSYGRFRQSGARHQRQRLHCQTGRHVRAGRIRRAAHAARRVGLRAACRQDSSSPQTVAFYIGVWPFPSRGLRTKVPPAGIEYVNVLLVSPFNFTAFGWPFVSKTSMRPVAAVPLELTSATCVAHPPPITNCGGRIAFAPPMLPAEPDPAGRIRVGTPVSVPVLAAPSVLKFVPANGKPRTAKGEPLWTLMLPMNAEPTSSGNNSFTNFANCLY